METHEKRIAQVFGAEEVPGVSRENLLKYSSHLIRHIDQKTVLTGREDFSWEEKYVFGIGDRAEYEKLKKTHPSYTDEYELLDLSANVTLEHDLLATVKRISDGKRFEIGLSWLTTKKRKGKDNQLLDDFAIWVVNW
jgi:hypothetical protein